ncbi:DUF3991 domain-containing protein [Rhizobium binxianense]
MEKNEIEELRGRVLCSAVLEKAGFAIDLKESTRRAVKYRRDGEIIIMIHDGHGWFDPLSEAKGDVFSLVGHLDGVGFPRARDRVAELVGFVPSEPAWKKPAREDGPMLGIAERWQARRKPWPGSRTWCYLAQERLLPASVLRLGVRHHLLREGPYGSMWAAHSDDAGAIVGWEERGPMWRGFTAGGFKVLFRFGPRDAPRICVTEAAIDAMSLAVLEDVRRDSLYLSTGGGWSPSTEAAVRLLAVRPGTLLVAATDNNDQGTFMPGDLRPLPGRPAAVLRVCDRRRATGMMN